MEDTVFDRIQDVDLQKTMETSYIDYAMSVIASSCRMSGTDSNRYREGSFMP